jgi:hypothetical protein
MASKIPRPHIKKLVPVHAEEMWPDHKNNAAGGDPYTGIVYLNREVWRGLKQSFREFILCHEEAHLALNTDDENEADRYAFYLFAKAGYPVLDAVEALNCTLGFPEKNSRKYAISMNRLKNMHDRACFYDYHVNGNKNANIN